MASLLDLSPEARLARVAIVLVLKALSKLENVEKRPYAHSLNLIEASVHKLRSNKLSRRERIRAAKEIGAHAVAMMMKALAENEEGK